jgi:SAM-dependent methyltransferase
MDARRARSRAASAATAPTSQADRYVHPDDARLAAWRRVYDNHLVVEDIYPRLARRLVDSGCANVAEIGGGRGPIARELEAHRVQTCVVDMDTAMLADAPTPVRGDLRQLPLATGSVDGVAAINCLYFLEDPVLAISEAWRVLRPGGLFVASSPSRWNDPELKHIDDRWGTPSTFDSEEAPALVARVFDDVTVEPWHVVAYVLPDTDAIADYLHAFNVAGWQEKAATIRPPLTITKVGAEVWARR